MPRRKCLVRCKVDVWGSSLQMFCIFQQLRESSASNLGPSSSNSSLMMTPTVHERRFRMLTRYGPQLQRPRRLRLAANCSSQLRLGFKLWTLRRGAKKILPVQTSDYRTPKLHAEPSNTVCPLQLRADAGRFRHLLPQFKRSGWRVDRSTWKLDASLSRRAPELRYSSAHPLDRRPARGLAQLDQKSLIQISQARGAPSLFEGPTPAVSDRSPVGNCPFARRRRNSTVPLEHSDQEGCGSPYGGRPRVGNDEVAFGLLR
jgi:hypothetical protein